MPSRTHTAAHEVSADRSAETRTRILDAALREFSAKGLAGARTEQIAAAAGVNKALLYYHFESKEKLYLAAFERAAEHVRDRSMAVFLREASPGERVLRIALDHFDRLLTQSEFQTLMQQEMMRVHQGEEGALPLLVKSVFGPMHAMFQSLVLEGIASGELIEADWLQYPMAVLGANVFYFLSAPVWRLAMAPFEPFARENAAGPAHSRGRVSGPGHLQRPGAWRRPRPQRARRFPYARTRRFIPFDRGKSQVNARNRVFVILGVLTIGSLIWYFVTTPRSSELQLIGTVDANEVVVSSRIAGKLQTLTVKEGDTVKAGQVIATIESDDLEAAAESRPSHGSRGKMASERDAGDGTPEPGRNRRARQPPPKRR